MTQWMQGISTRGARRLVGAMLAAWLAVAAPGYGQPATGAGPAGALPLPPVVDVPPDPQALGAPPLTLAALDGVLKATRERLDAARASQRVYDDAEAERLVSAAERVLRELALNPDVAAFGELLESARKGLLQAQIIIMPSRAIELRGVYLDGDAIPASADGIAALVRKLKGAGFNALFPEIFRRGYTMYRSRITEVDPTFAKSGVDVLASLLKAAKANGMEVYPWIWTFRVQSPSLKIGNPILDRLPSLAAVPLRRNGGDDQQADPDEPMNDETTSFISPAAPEWRQLLTTMLAEVVQNYPIDGYVLDYIRYGDRQTEDQLSYTNFQLDYLRRTGQFPPRQFEQGTELYAQWHLWREEQVHLMVQELTRQLVRVRQGLSLGAAVFRGEINARTTKMQDWRHWTDNNWLDFVTPMMYTDATDHLDAWLDWETDQGKRQDVLYPVLGAHRLSRTADLFNLIGLLQSRNVPGMSIFAIRQLNDEMLTLLGKGPFRTPARPPHHNLPKAVQEQMRGTAAWLLAVLRQPAAADAPPPAYQPDLQSLATELQVAADQLLASAAPDGAPDPASLQVGVMQIRAHLDRLGQTLPPALAAEIAGQLDYAAQLARIYQAHHRPDQAYVKASRPPVAVLPEALPLPATPVVAAAPPPTIDGSLSEMLWQKAPALSQFFWNTGSSRPQAGTRVRLAFDRDAVYVAYENEEPRLDRVRALTRASNSDYIFRQDDTVEVFLSPGDRPKAYYYFVLNMNNAQYSRASFDTAWLGEWQSAVKQTDRGWNAEMRIPFSTMRVGAPDRGGKWRANFCRRRWQEVNSYQCWSFTFGGVHRADRFGTLQFRALPAQRPDQPPPDELAPPPVEEFQGTRPRPPAKARVARHRHTARVRVARHRAPRLAGRGPRGNYRVARR